ncbi:MAG: hypothetical protein ABSE62_15985 [Chthoniobacteraceae bacterium]
MTQPQFFEGLSEALKTGNPEEVEAFLKKANDLGFDPGTGIDRINYEEDLHRILEGLPWEIVHKIITYFGAGAGRELGEGNSNDVEALCVVLGAAGMDPAEDELRRRMGVSRVAWKKHATPGAISGLEALCARRDARRIQRFHEVADAGKISPEQAEVNRRMGISEEQFRRHNGQ